MSPEVPGTSRSLERDDVARPGPQAVSKEASERIGADLARIKGWHLRAAAAIAVAFGAVATLPLFLDTRFYLVLATLTVMWMGLASAYNVFTGYCGYLSFGHAAFVGLGAYVVGIGTTRYALGLPAALFAAFALGGVFALVLGLLTLRIRGHYFAIATLGVAEATRALINHFRGFTKGTFGFGLPIDITLLPAELQFYVMLGIVALTVAASAAVLWSRFGARLLAIREDETAAEAVGINTAWYKIAALGISGAFSGLLGGMFAWTLGFLTPETVFSPVISLQMVVMTIIGGTGTISGPLIGGAAFYLLREQALQTAPSVHLIVMGVLLVVGMLLLRRGIVGTLQEARFWPKGLRI